jgi:hypothetical protein
MPGKATERLAVEDLQAAGYETYRPPKAKYREQDVFGLYDILAFGHGQLLGIQVKGGRDASGITTWFEDARTHEEHLTDVGVQFWHRTDDTWRVAEPTPESYAWEFDGRETVPSDSRSVAEVLR